MLEEIFLLLLLKTIKRKIRLNFYKMISLYQSKTVEDSKKNKKKIKSGMKYVNVLPWKDISLKHETSYHEFSPFFLKTDGGGYLWNPPGVIFENIWQALKVYPEVGNITVKPNHMSNIIWWEWTKGRTVLFENGDVTDNYLEWFWSICNCKNPVRSPVHRSYRKNCKFSIGIIGDEVYKLSYLEARLFFYYDQYVRLVKQLPLYQELLNDLNNGEHLCITEVDVPAKDKSGGFGDVDDDGFYLCSADNLEELILDPSEPFGHGICLAHALLSDLDSS